MLTKSRFISAGDVGVLETLMRHDVAPVAGGIADRQQDRLVELVRLGERVRDQGRQWTGIVLVLQEIGAGLFGEQIGCGSGTAVCVPAVPLG